VTPSWLEFERAGFQTRVAAYHRFFAPICMHVAGPVLDAVRAGAGSRVLDACCGPGYVAGRALERGCTVQGIDLSTAMVELAAALHPGGRFHAGDVEVLPFDDGEFDAVVCNISIHHVTDPARAVAEFGRVLRPDGRVALTTWDESRSEIGIVKSAIAAVDPVVPAGLPSPPERPDYDDEDEVRRLLGSAGLRLASFTPVTFPQRYADTQTLWDGWLATAIRTGPLFDAQPQRVQRAAREAFERMVAHHRQPDGSVSLRASVHLAVGER
jgi:SAM-dependent methyltransferase